MILALEDGSPYDDGRLTYHWTLACRAAGVRGHTFHSTRHRFATTLLARGLDVASVAKLMGHKTADMVIKRYAHVTDDYEERARQALGVSTAAPARRSSRG